MGLGSIPLLGVLLAVVSAAALAGGNLLQARGVRGLQKVTSSGRGTSSMMRLLRSRTWLAGALFLALAMLLQLGALTFAPLIVVQPVGVTALIFTAVFTSVAMHRRPLPGVTRAIAICVLGVGGFVAVAALVSTQHPIGNVQLVAVLLALAVALALVAVVWFLARTRAVPPISWVLLGAICSAFVATLGKTVILRVQTILRKKAFRFDSTDLLTLACVVAILVAGGLSVYLVQRAHVANRPEVVVAGLTVIDPAVAIVLGITILGEASDAPAWTILVFVAAGAVAVGGVIALAHAESATDTVADSA